MLKTSLLILFALCVAIGGGAASAWYALQAPEGVGSVEVGGWTAFPDVGTPEADPYSKGRIARDGVLTLGRAEGLVLVARRDAGGQLLRRECRYTMEGIVPQARFWTLYAADQNLSALTQGITAAPGLHSRELLRRPDDSVAIAVSSRAAPGNWLATSGEGPLALVLTLYDTQLGAEAGLADIELPRVVSAGCHA